MKRVFLLLFAMVVVISSPANAKIYYVGLSGMPDNSSNLPATVAQAMANSGVDTIYIGLGIYKLNSELFINDVVIGGCSVSGGKVTRQYPGAVGNQRAKMTVLDGNSFVLSLPSQKHRVATINAGGIIDGCLIRNGHARGTTNNPNDTKGFGGGVLINTGGKLHNSIVRGNVAMNLQFSKTNPSYGGGVYVNGGDVANCIIAFNLDDMGLGIGATHGTILNNTIVRNANAPRYVLISGTNGTPYRHYQNTNSLTYLEAATLVLPYIELDSFYMATTETTMGQYACFLAAIDLASNYSASDWTAMCSAKTPMSGYIGIAISKYLGMTAAEVSTPPTLLNAHASNTHYLGITGTVGSGSEVFYPLKGASAYTAGTSGGISYPKDPLIRDNFPMGWVNWYGSVAFCVWIGGMLPTEAQWEYAARKNADGSVQVSAAYTGGYTDPDKVGWHMSNSGNPRSPHEVATLLPSGVGLYDMCGNQWERCADWYYNSNRYPAGTCTVPSAASINNAYVSTVSGRNGSTAAQAVHNPIYNFSGTKRTGRGGCWGVGGTNVALGYRPALSGSEPGGMSYLGRGVFGFRCAACTGL